MYDCTHPDLLISILVSTNEEKCLRLQNKSYSVAFYGVSDTNTLSLEKYPGKVDTLSLMAYNEPSTRIPSECYCSVLLFTFSIIAVTAVVNIELNLP